MFTSTRAGFVLPAVILIFAMLVCLCPVSAYAADTAPTSSTTFTFSDSGVTVSGEESGYKISGTALTINESGVYAITGSCSEGSITVKKGTTGVTLILQDLTLSCSTTAPLACNKTTEVTLYIAGTVTLMDKEDPANETSTDTEIADAFEGAAIKVKSGASLTITGSGTLNADGSACKNGIKGAATAAITVAGATINISAANNGLASDGEVIITGGELNITAGNDGIKSEPDEDDTESAGCVTISGGTVTIVSTGDGVQAAEDLTISGGTFDITTFGGYNASGFDSDTMSAKGLKASGNTDDDSDTSDSTNDLIITGGAFNLNCADDAIHSDGYIVITGGTFTIYSGDDGVHADTSLTLGAQNAANCAVQLTVKSCYEGLEAGNVYIYSGSYDVTSSDDGINAAGGNGGSTEGFNPGGGPGNSGGFMPGNPGGGGGGMPGGPGMTGGSGDYSINIYGGLITVNASGDGIDSNGALNMTGGTVIVWGGANDENPLDYDGSFTVSGATVFAAGSNQMASTAPTSGSQAYKTRSGSISSGSVITVSVNNSTVLCTKAVKSVNYVFYSSPSMGSANSCSISVSSGSATDVTNWADHVDSNSDGWCDNCGAELYPHETEEGEETAPVETIETVDPFTDVYVTDYYADAVGWAAANGITNGTSASTFSPTDGCTRAQVVTFLWRASGSPEPDGTVENPFSDVSENDYYYNAVLWAYANGITTGTTDSTFSPNDTCTRAQVVTFLYRLENEPEADGESPFSDVGENDYFHEAVLWAYANGVTTGTTDSTFSPNDTCTRAQIVTFLWRALA